MLVRWKEPGNPDTLLHSPTYRLVHLQTLTWSLTEGQQLGRPRDLMERTELCSFGARAGRPGAIVDTVGSLTHV